MSFGLGSGGHSGCSVHDLRILQALLDHESRIELSAMRAEGGDTECTGTVWAVVVWWWCEY